MRTFFIVGWILIFTLGLLTEKKPWMTKPAQEGTVLIGVSVICLSIWLAS